MPAEDGGAGDRASPEASTSAVTLDSPAPAGEAYYHSAWEAAQPALSQLRSELPHFSTPPLRVSRVGQLDSSLLDRELETILRDPVWKALELLRGPGRIGWEPEFLALLRMAVMRWSVWEGGATYGAKLQNLRWRDERAHHYGLQSTAKDAPLSSGQTAMYTALTILPPYLHTRLRDSMLSAGWSDHPSAPLTTIARPADNPTDAARKRQHLKRLAWDVLSRSEQIWQTLGLINFLIFLFDGRYRTVVERFLGMRLVYAKRAVTRNVSFEFLNRQLVWEAMTEFLLFLMPLINLRRLRSRAIRVLSTTRSKTLSTLLTALPEPLKRMLRLPSRARAIRSSGSGSGSSSDSPQGAYAFLPPGICAICFSLSTAPPTSLPIVTDPSASTAALSSLTHDAHTSTNAGGTVGTKDSVAQIPCRVDCCGGLYCYYCIVGRMVAWDEEEGSRSEGWPCLRCGNPVRSAERWTGDVETEEEGEGEKVHPESKGKVKET